ncbi:unnamed protein product [Phytophthora fragariaefolia]|uniref:Unnamed protein product n=1 Tax=Phytophthora fragariaefolia TaxID=1490495 RepID=A0A9W7D5T4_9STRA|nr:unnamed protein product [Phytophthora fragariaefolia]
MLHPGLGKNNYTVRLDLYPSTGNPSTQEELPVLASRIPTPKKAKLSKRFKWPNDMIAELLRLHFADSDGKRRLESAQTKTQTALAWQYFASVLSQSVGVVIKTDQVRDNDISYYNVFAA